MNGIGGYSRDNKSILSVVLSRKEYMLLKHHIKIVDPKAFISVTFMHEVIGEGFDLRLREKRA